MTWTHRCIVVPVANLPLARDLCAATAGPSGVNMWPAGANFSATGLAPGTSAINEGSMQTQFAGLLPFDTITVGALGVITKTRTSPGDATTAASMATTNGYTVTALTVQALYDV